MRAFAPGIYPRSEALVQATRDLERGRTSPKAVAEQGERDFQELVSVQRAADLSFLSDGMLGWQDLFRPLAEAAEGLDARPLTRFLDTNTFYRGVLVDGEPRLRNPLPPPDLPDREWIGTLPSPLAFARAARDEVSAETLAADVLGPQIAGLDWMPAPHSSSSASRLPPVKEAQTRCCAPSPSSRLRPSHSSFPSETRGRSCRRSRRPASL